MIHQLSRADLNRFTDLGVFFDKTGHYLALEPFEGGPKKNAQHQEMILNLYGPDRGVEIDVSIYKKQYCSPDILEHNKQQFDKIWKYWKEEEAHFDQQEADRLDWERHCEKQARDRQARKEIKQFSDSDKREERVQLGQG